MSSLRHIKGKKENEKRVHYSPSTKAASPPHSSHRHRSHNSRDSGVGSSSASDRASIAASYPLSGNLSSDNPSATLSPQTDLLSAVQEALSAANARILGLESQIRDLDYENHLLKEEKARSYSREENLDRQCEELRIRLRVSDAPATAALGSESHSSSSHASREKRKDGISSRSSKERSREGGSSGYSLTSRSGSHVRSRDSDDRTKRERRGSVSWATPLCDSTQTASEQVWSDNSYMPQSRTWSTPRTMSNVAFSPAPITYSHAPLSPRSAGVGGAASGEKQQGMDPRYDGMYYPYPL